jgi:hypothetical protein
MDPVVRWCSQALRQSPRPRHLRKRTRSQGPSLHRNYPVSSVICPCPTPARTAAFRDVEAATLAHDGSPPITRTTFPTCRAHYPGGSNGCACRLLPRSYSLPQMAGGSASALSLSRPAQALLTLRPTGSLSRPRRPLSRGSSPSGYPAEPPVSYQINRQLSGWIPPPQVIRAFGAHGHKPTSRLRLEMKEESWIAELGARNAPLVQTVVPFVASDSCSRILTFGPPLTRPERPGRRKPTWDQADFRRRAVS